MGPKRKSGLALKGGAQKGGAQKGGAPNGGAPNGGPQMLGAPKGGKPKISCFFFRLPPPIFALSVSLWGLFVVFWLCLEASGRSVWTAKIYFLSVSRHLSFFFSGGVSSGGLSKPRFNPPPLLPFHPVPPLTSLSLHLPTP